MSPVEIPRSSGRTARVRFVENVSYGGVDYGPSYKAKEAEVRVDWARYFVRAGKAEYVTAAEPEIDGTEDDGESEEQSQETGEGDTPEEEQLPDDLQGVDALRAVGVTTWDALAAVPDLTQIPGIGTKTAKAIAAELEERADD